ncbi:histidine phosphatase family protein [Brevibacillus dissolubilis]|uniref:histidine phosphatase family protein n=1 Tax=Brevibacillus dissolubilis TaxID=1844116 RepID=UPI0011160C1C|nr:histidine phosphatase family protein [Brevibacillus dissolubilis]
MLTLIWARHAVTTENQQKRYIGHHDALLSETGIEQARQLGEKLKDVRIDAAYSSDLQRAVRTAEAIASHHPGLTVEKTEDLREIAFGRWEAKTYDELFPTEGDALVRFYDDPWEHKPTDGESLDDMQKRLESFLARLLSRHGDGETVLAVSHGGMIKLFLTLYIDRDPKRYFEQTMLHGTSLTCQYDEQTGEWSVVS